MKSFSEYIKGTTITESSLSRLANHYENHDSGTISAFRGEYEKSENMKRNAKLKSILLGAGFSVTSIKGYFTENYGTPEARDVKEESFFVVDYNDKGNLKNTLIKLGELFGQDSITYSNKHSDYFLIGTSKKENAYPPYHTEMKLGRPMFGKNGEFYSRVNGRPFVFEESINNDRHDFDDTLLKYNTAHKQILVREARKYIE